MGSGCRIPSGAPSGSVNTASRPTPGTALANTEAQNAERKERAATRVDGMPPRTLSAKTINNCLTVLRRLLAVAKKRGIIESVPEVEWLRTDRPEFDFLEFEEADRLLGAAVGEWRTMILVDCAPACGRASSARCAGRMSI